MNHFGYIFLLGSFLLVAFSPVSIPPTYKIISNQAKVGFVIKNAGLNVDGTFSGLTGNIEFDTENVSLSKIEATIPVNTLDTGINKRDKDLLKEDYFDINKYPIIRFVSSSVRASGEGYSVTGDFTIKATTKSVVIPFTFTNNQFKGDFSIDRRDYGVGGNSWIMGDKVKISFEIPVEEM